MLFINTLDNNCKSNMILTYFLTLLYNLKGNKSVNALRHLLYLQFYYDSNVLAFFLWLKGNWQHTTYMLSKRIKRCPHISNHHTVYLFQHCGYWASSPRAFETNSSFINISSVNLVWFGLSIVWLFIPHSTAV